MEKVEEKLDYKLLKDQILLQSIVRHLVIYLICGTGSRTDESEGLVGISVMIKIQNEPVF